MTAPLDITSEPLRSPMRSFSRRVRLLGALAWPVILTRAGILTMAMADIVMVGRYDGRELAYAALGNALFIVVLVTGIGLCMGTLTLASQAFGAGDLRECGRALRRGLAWAVAIGLVSFALIAPGEIWLRLIGHEAELAAEGGAVAFAVAFGAPTALAHVVCSFWLESIRRPTPGLIAMGAANLLNIGLNYVLIYGAFGAPEMGAVGSAIATALVRTALFVALFGYIVTRPERAAFGLDRLRHEGGERGLARFWGPGGWAAGARMRRLGWAAGAALSCETTAWFAFTQFAGLLGADTLAAFAIAHNVEAVIFMAGLGVATATAVLVGNATGAGDVEGAAAAGWTGLGVGFLVATALGAGLAAFAGAVAAGFVQEPRLISATAALMGWVGAVAALDAAQMIMSQACRATGDAWAVTARTAVSFWLTATPAAWLFGVVWGWGAPGLLLGALLGCALNLGLVCARFQTLMRRAAKDAG